MAKLDKYNFSRSEWNNYIEEWIIGRNGERDRAIMRRRLFDGVSFEQIAEEYDLSTQRAHEIVYAAQTKLLCGIEKTSS